MPKRRKHIHVEDAGAGSEVGGVGADIRVEDHGRGSEAAETWEVPAETAVSMTAAVTGIPGGLIGAALAAEPAAVTVRLQRIGARGRVIETNVARAPIFGPSRAGSPVQLALEWHDVGPVYGRQFMVRGPALTVRDELLIVLAMTEYVRAGCPPHRRVPFSLGEAARLLGARSVGGSQRELVKQSLRRLRSVSFESTVRTPDGHEEAMGWGLIDSWRTSTRGGGRGWLTLSEPVAGLLLRGSATLLDGPTLVALADRDEIAARLWTYLEADRPGTWHHNLYAAPPGEPARERNMPAVADLLRLHDAQRRRVARKIAAACAVIADVDPRYRLRVVKSRERGMWRLEAARGRAIEGRPPPVDGQLGVAQTGSWGSPRRAVGGHSPDQNRGVPSYPPSSSTVVGERNPTIRSGVGPEPIGGIVGRLRSPGPGRRPEPPREPDPDRAARLRERARQMIEAGDIPPEHVAELRRRYGLDDEDPGAG